MGLALGAVSLLFPFIALFLAHPLGPMVVVLALVAVLVLRAVTGLGKKQPQALTWAALAAACLLGIGSTINANLAMRLYPVLMNLAMLSAFALSLVRPPTMIERFARVFEPDLPEAGVRYTRTVTWIWCAFFVLNGSIALWTALEASLATWALYNGLVSYSMMGLLLGGEFLVRGPVRRREERRAASQASK
ncbi:MAG: hypothetical protein GC155_02355 [Alphaproteobacteria bacterium]|nr:hypothetical protein [Alphaproteobacteria bacterium]